MGALTINGTKLDEAGEIVEYPEGLEIDNIRLTITGSEQGTIVSNETVVGVWGTLERNSASIEIERIPFELGYPQEKITVTAVITHRNGQLTATGTYTMPAHGRDLTLSVTVFDNTAGGDIDYGTDDNGEIVWYPMLGATYYLDGIKLNDAGDDFVYPSEIYTSETGRIIATGRDGRALADNQGVDMDIEDVTGSRATLSADYLPLNIEHGLYDNETIHFELGVLTNFGYITRSTDYTFRAPYTITHLVTFETEYGSPPRSQYVNHGEYARDPGAVDPAGADYTFDFWYDPSNTTALVPFDFANTPITGDLTLVAHWTENNTDDLSLGITIEEHLDQFEYATDNNGNEIVFLSIGTKLTISGNALEVVNDQLVYPESIDELVHIKVTDDTGNTLFEEDVEGSLDIENNVPVITIEQLPMEAPVHPEDTLGITATVTHSDGTLEADTEYVVPRNPADRYSMTLELYYNTPSWVYPAGGGDPQANIDLYGMLFLEGLEISGETVTDPEGLNGEDIRITIVRDNGTVLNSTAWGQPYVNDEGKLQITLISIPVEEPLDQNEPVTVTATVYYDGGEITADAQFVVPEKAAPDPSQMGMTFAAVDDGEEPPITTLDGIDIAFPNVTGTLTISGTESSGSTLIMPDSIDTDNITVNFSDGDSVFDQEKSGTLNVGSGVTITIDDLFSGGWPAGKTVTLTATVPYTYNGTAGNLTATTTYEVPDVPAQPGDLSLSLELSDDPTQMESTVENGVVKYFPAITPVITLEGAVVENGAVTDPRSIADTVTFTFTRSTDSTTAPTVSFDAAVRIEGQDVYIDVPQFTLPYQGLFEEETVTAVVTLVCDGKTITSNTDAYSAPSETNPNDISLSVSINETNQGSDIPYNENLGQYYAILNAIITVDGAEIDPTNGTILYPEELDGGSANVMFTITGTNGREILVQTRTGNVTVSGNQVLINVADILKDGAGDSFGLYDGETVTVTVLFSSDDLTGGYRKAVGTYTFNAPSAPAPVAPDFAVNSDSTALFYGSGNFEYYNGLIDSASVDLDVDALNNDGTVNSLSAVIQKFEAGSPGNTAATHNLDYVRTDTGYHISGLSFTNLQLTGVNDEIYVVITMNYTLDGETKNKDVRIPVELALYT